MLSGLYVISDEVLTPQIKLVDSIEKVLSCGARVVQYRDKSSSKERIRINARKIQRLCKKYNAKFILNDYSEIAIEENFDGLHVGKSDHHRVEEIRKSFSGYLGISCYGNVMLAKEMQEKGVDYVAFGSFFKSPTKPASDVVGLEVLSQAKKQLNIPICAIGGINSTNVAQVMKHSPDMIALISDIWKSEDIGLQSKLFSKLYKG